MPYITPQSIPTPTLCRRLSIPNDIDIIAAVNGALLDLTLPWNWEQVTGVAPDDIAGAMLVMWRKFMTIEVSCMIGAILPFATGTLPDGVLPCDGTTYNRVDYPDLYAALDAVFIVDADTFNTPDLRNNFPVGAGDNYSIGDTGGENTHTLTIAEMPNHAHYYTPPVFNVDLETPGAPDVFAAGIGLPVLTDDEGGGGAHENRPPYLALNYGIIAR